MANRHYKLEDIALTVAGIPIYEFAKGDAITVTYSDDDVKVSEGSHGATCRSMIPNTVGTATLNLFQSSPINELLSDLWRLDKRTGLGTGIFDVSDPNGTSYAVAERCWVKKCPEYKNAVENSIVVWVLDLVGLDVNLGQNRFV